MCRLLLLLLLLLSIVVTRACCSYLPLGRLSELTAAQGICMFLGPRRAKPSQAKPGRPESDACWPKYRQAWWTGCLSVSHSSLLSPLSLSLSLFLAVFVCLCLSLSVSVFVYHFDLAQFVTGSLSSYGLLVGLVCLFAQPAYGHQQVPTPTTP